MTPTPSGSAEQPPERVGLRFSRERHRSAYLLPEEGGGWRRVELSAELRRDPLTGRSGRLAHYQGFKLRRPDLTATIEASLRHCPFCPERILEVTPRLPPEVAPQGRISQGEALLFPNISPYDGHSIVVVLTRRHFVPPEELAPQFISDGVGAAQSFFRALPGPPRGSFSLLFWNYMPLSGATQVHPHMQGFRTDRPGSLLEEEVRRSRAFRRRRGRIYWEQLVEEERHRGERFVADGRQTAWLTPYVSRSVISDLMAVFPEVGTLEELSVSALGEFAKGISAALKVLSAEGVVGFNLAFYPRPSGDGQEHFWLHARLSPRIYFNPAVLGSDNTSWQQLLDEPVMVRAPEALADSLREPLRAALG